MTLFGADPLPLLFGEFPPGASELLLLSGGRRLEPRCCCCCRASCVAAGCCRAAGLSLLLLPEELRLCRPASCDVVRRAATLPGELPPGAAELLLLLSCELRRRLVLPSCRAASERRRRLVLPGCRCRRRAVSPSRTTEMPPLLLLPL